MFRKLQIENPIENPIEEHNEIQVLRRFSDFIHLKANIEKESMVKLPELPPKYSFFSLIGSYRNVMVEIRRKELERWLKKTLEVIENEKSIALEEFLTEQKPIKSDIIDFFNGEVLQLNINKYGPLEFRNLLTGDILDLTLNSETSS
eukprot:c22278_g1_i1.p1 GENE.c22278_g1_i1~~c22278_g1_i1.p1  ORF type:complete len:147 (-),score=49.63 c22278_g1_i1:30-470(-)